MMPGKKKNRLAAILLAAFTLPGTLAFADSWPFTPDWDHFAHNAMVDLRPLNEKVAGQAGFITRTPDGNDFALPNGDPIRFWSINDYNGALPMDKLQHHARWLAKRGVNMVRLHLQISPEKGQPFLQANPKILDQIFKTVAAMKAQGIYTTISPYWASIKIPAAWGVPGPDNQPAWGLLFFDPRLQQGYKAWTKQLLTTPNPYTGIPLAKDPAVAILQIQNEDSLLFWTEQGLKGPALDELRHDFGIFLAKKYGSLNAAKAAWPNAGAPGDNFAAGMPGMYILWDLTQPQIGDKAKRCADQAEFLTETMRHFNAMIVDYFHHDLGCRQLVNAGNWQTADAVKLYDLERYSYTPADVMAVNRYVAGIHEGDRRGWAQDNGDHYTNLSVLKDPRALPLNIKQVAGYPMIVTESGWTNPDLYQAEGPFLTAAYASLTGVDSLFWFSIGDGAEWQQPFNPPTNGWHPPMSKWDIGTPMQLGQFPAAALMFRNHYLKEAAPVVKEIRTPHDLWNRELPLIAEDQSYDPNRNQGDTGSKSAALSVDPLAYLVGPVTVQYTAGGGRSTVADLAPFIDRNKGTILSASREILLNYHVGYCTVNTPCAQGACGFLHDAGTIKLDNVSLATQNKYASILVVSLDKLPLATSKKILVQLGTVERPRDWLDHPAKFLSRDRKKTYTGFQIDSTGRNPWEIETLKGTLSISNPALARATVLDANMMPDGNLQMTRNGDVLRFTLPEKAMYVCLSE